MNPQAHYIRLYKAADEVLRQPDNPCQIRKEGENITCVRSRAGYEPHNVLCCEGCEHLGPEGCTVMSLGCKLGWCRCYTPAISDQAVSSHPTFEKIASIKAEAERLSIPLQFRRSYKETFVGG